MPDILKGDVLLNKDKVLKYSAFMTMLKTLLKRDLISDEEYQVILRKINKDMGVVSNLST